MAWKTIGVSVAGFSHQSSGAPCQDFHMASCLPQGWLVAAVSDGAGSALRSFEGAKTICERLVSDISDGLLKSDDIQRNMRVDQVIARQWIVDTIESAREELTKSGGEGSLSQFHATLVAVIAGPNGGTFFHIGDGAACATDINDLSSSSLSLPENGEYANETYFYTQPEWKDHLRLTEFDGRFNLIALMTDGVTPFALAPQAAGIYIPFFEPVSKFLSRHPIEDGKAALAATLAKEEIRKITGDDKTLIWALRTDGDD
jgi:hypothetical protein